MKQSLPETYSIARAYIYASLLTAPCAEWTVKDLAATLPAEVQVPRDAIRCNLYLMLADRLAELVFHRTTFTVRLTGSSVGKVAAIVEGWRANGWCVPS